MQRSTERLKTWNGKDRAVFDGGQGGLRYLVDPQKVLQNLIGGVDSNPPNNPSPDSILMLNQYIYVQLYAAYQFGNLRARYSRSDVVQQLSATASNWVNWRRKRFRNPYQTRLPLAKFTVMKVQW